MNDLISRQVAIDAINHICPVDTEYDCTLLDRVDVRYVLSELPSAQQWIPVEKETPILPNVVLVCDSLGKILFDSYIDGSWTYCPYVVAWLPLPSPYREEVLD